MIYLNTLNPVATKCYALGLQLEVQYPQLQSIEQEYRRCEDQLREIVAKRLKQIPPLTWLDIVRALRTDTLGENRLASEIESRYSSSRPAVSGADQPVPPPVQAEPSLSHFPTQTLPPLQGPPESVGQESVSMPMQTTPPQQPSIYVQSNGQTATTIDSVHCECGISNHKSQVVLHVTDRHTSDLTRTIANDLTYFSNKFIELGFISRDAYDSIITKGGIGNAEKGGQLLSLVIANSHISCDKKQWFEKFVSVFYSEAAYASLGTSMTKDFKNIVSDHSSMHSTTQPPRPLGVHLHSVPSGQLQSSTARATSHVDAFIHYVRTIYREDEVERDTSVVKWPPTPSKLYINLVCIDRKSAWGKKSEYDKVTEAMVRHGSMDAIIWDIKGPIQFSEIAKDISISNSRERAAFSVKKSDKGSRLILVEGAPGVGKSTFAREFCRRWERGDIAQQYQLVLLLRLREEGISNARSLEDLIYHPSKDVHHSVCTELESNLGANTLIILEGFDELPDICRKAGSIFMDLIAGKLLPLTTVLVTSRPWATKGIRLKHQNRIYQHIEILGFTDNQITEYIKSTVSQEKASELKGYLERHPQIRAGMYIPLNSAIIVTVYEESQASGCTMPTTLTELYTSLSQTLLLRYLHGHPEYEAGSRTMQRFEDLPPPVHAKFRQLCKIAYNGTVSASDQVQLIFRSLPSGFDDLGFMDSVTELYVTQGAVSSHNFLHLTFQEFFAAVHISTLSQAEQMHGAL